MPITREDVLKIAELSRLELTGDEVDAFTEQLGSILNHIDKLNELDTSNVEPLSPTTASGDNDYTRRDDIVEPSLGQQTAVANAPDTSDGYFKVPKVIGG